MVHMIVYWLCHCFVSYFVELEAIRSDQKGFITFASSYREKRISLPAKYYPLDLEGYYPNISSKSGHMPNPWRFSS